MAPSGADSQDYYGVLGLQRRATEEEIRRAYHGIVRQLHPDRRQPGAGGDREAQALEQFRAVQSAWRCLSDPTRRLLYDLRNYGESAVAADMVEGGLAAEDVLRSLQEEQAKRDLCNMEVAHQRILRRETAANGVLVRRALYGDLRLRADRFAEGLSGKRTIEVGDLVGPTCDVTVPLQCLVERHMIVITGSVSSSKADLPGFYNPVPLSDVVELELYVLYEFQGRLHEVLVGDRETLSLPKRKHTVPQGAIPRGPFSAANTSMLHARGLPLDTASVRANDGAAPTESPQESPREWRATKALQQAVADYRVQRIREQDSEVATAQEFTLVLAVAGVIVGALWLANYLQRQSRAA